MVAGLLWNREDDGTETMSEYILAAQLTSRSPMRVIRLSDLFVRAFDFTLHVTQVRSRALESINRT
jgi:hypothetical protein